jgi:hypothetical protein
MILRTVLRFAFGLAVLMPGIVRALTVTQNGFVSAVVSQGLLTIYKGNYDAANPGNNENLTFNGFSFLTVNVNGYYYTNNGNLQIPAVGGVVVPASHIILLMGDQTKKIKDTISTVWKESGFDIVQKVYPVAFSNSGVIVISISIVDHSAEALQVQAQYLLDNMNSNRATGPYPRNANDNPYIIDRYGYLRNWQDCPPSPLPSFYLAFENPLDSSYLGTVGIGYLNDSFPPSPLGLLPLSFLEFGYLNSQVWYSLFGPVDGTYRTSFADVATLMMGQQTVASGNTAPDSVTEIMRTAYGTPEWCYQHGSLFGFALYPHHIYWNPVSGTYSPNPFPIEAFLFNVTQGGTSNTMITQTVGEPINIVSPHAASPYTSQTQNVGSIQADGVASVGWMDSVLTLPTGCASSFQVDLQFSVVAGGIATPIFDEPWDNCSITVDCANPDTLPPAFQNSFAGCDSIIYDTVTVHDNGEFDLGLDSITYTSKDMTPAQYRVTISPPPPYQCLKTPVKIYVAQVDTFKSGHVIFTFTDCANNVSRDTLCFTAHPPLPDKTAPVFWSDSAVADCHARCTEWSVTDTLRSNTSIDRGIDSIIIVSATNMTLSGVPNGGKYPTTDTPEVFFRVCVTDSMLDGTIILRASDTAHNARFDTVTYCTTPDTLPPIITAQQYNHADSSWHVHVTETRAWDRGIDSVWLVQTSNVVTVPSPLPYPIGCTPTFDFRVRVIDTTQCASATVFARDCAKPTKNVSSLPPLTFTKGTIPVIAVSKTVLCNANDSSTLDAGAGFSAYLWSTGETTRQIVIHKAGKYSVTVQEGAGCPASADTTITSSPATPTISPAGPIAICAPNAEKLDAGSPYTTYQWLKDGNLISGATSETISAGSTGNYSVQVTNSAGCEGTSPVVSVTVNALPPPPKITAVNSVMTSTPNKSYQWSRNDTILHGDTNQTYTDLTGGSYTVTITDSNGCSSTSQPFSNAGSTVIAVPALVQAKESDNLTIPLSIVSSQGLPLNLNRAFTVKISFNKTMLVPNGPPAGGTIGTPTVNGNNLVVPYTARSSSTQGVIAELPFIAALGDDSCTAITIESFTWNAPSISVTLVNGEFCDTGLCKQGGTRLINPDTQLTLSAAQPNPANNSIQINYRLIEHGRTRLVVYDVLGREVLRLVDADMEPGSYTVDADVSMLPAGTYVYSLRTPTIVKSNHLEIAR